MTARGIAASTLVLTAYTVYSWSGVGLSVALAQIIESLQLPVESVGLIPTVWGIGLDAFSLAAGTLRYYGAWPGAHAGGGSCVAANTLIALSNSFLGILLPAILAGVGYAF